MPAPEPESDAYSRMIPPAGRNGPGPKGPGDRAAVERELAPQRLPVRREDPPVVRGLVHDEDHDPGARVIARP